MNRARALETATYIIVPTAMVVVSPLAGKLLDSMYFPHSGIFSSSLWLLLAGLFVSVAGLALVFWTILLFKTIGRGTPNPKLPPKELVIAGPYRWTRNPMALGGLVFLMGEALVYYSPSLFGIAILFGLILYFNAMWIEEPELRKRFGAPYEAYIKCVPRFFPNPFKKGL